MIYNNNNDNNNNNNNNNNNIVSRDPRGLHYQPYGIMDSCPICGGEGFENLDGHYYCLECGTQSQVRKIMFEWNIDLVSYHTGTSR